MIRFALFALLLLAASAAPSSAACHPVARVRTATARAANAVAKPVRLVRERRPFLLRPTPLLMRWRLAS